MSEKKRSFDWPALQHRLFRMVSVGVIDDNINKGYDILSTAVLILNLVVSVMLTFEGFRDSCGLLLERIEAVTVFFFAVDFILRLITARYLYPTLSDVKAGARYVVSAAGIIDWMSFLPYYLPVFFPTGAAAFRMFRVVRIFRLFRINAYYDSLNVITEVIRRKKQQLLSSVFIILVLMLASSLCMYSLEHEAQPEVFTNAFSGIWWSVSTLLTVGYGDIYPITPLGQAFSIVITFLGVGMVAIPTGIISAGFVEQYTRLEKIGDYAAEKAIHFIQVKVGKSDAWAGKSIRDLKLPHGMIIAVVLRGSETLAGRGQVILQTGDILIIGAQSAAGSKPVELKELTLRSRHPWNGQRIRDLDISRQTTIVMVRRKGKVLIPRGELVLNEGDEIMLYSKVSLNLPPEDQVSL